MVITAWSLVVGAGSRPRFGGENVVMLGDSMVAVHGKSKCRGGKDPKSGTLMRTLGCLELRIGWYFPWKHARGVANTLADGISRWERDNSHKHPREYRPDINWQEQNLGQTRRDLCTGIMASGTSVGRWRTRLIALACHLSGLGSNFKG